MHFQYRGINSSRLVEISITLPQLATYILTDWISKTPNSVANSFADFLSEILEVYQANKQDFWCIKSEASCYEKQWKQMTSWILGVAFAKRIMEEEGYSWWAPVSAFTAKSAPIGPLLGYWNPNLPYTNCRIVMPNPRLSKLYPDYVLARFKGSKYEISFAEVKGSVRNLENINQPPMSWRDQARNAIFVFRNQPKKPRQNLVIATRVNPKAITPPSRCILVRAWNSKDPTDEIEIDEFKEILKIHYFGICQRIGLSANASLIALESFLQAGKDHDVSSFLNFGELSEIQGQLKQDAEQEIETTILKRIPDIQFLIGGRGATFPVGRKLIRIGLSKAAIDIVRYFQGQTDVYIDKRSLEALMKELQNTTKATQKMVESEGDVFIREDGIISELIEFPKAI